MTAREGTWEISAVAGNVVVELLPVEGEPGDALTLVLAADRGRLFVDQLAEKVSEAEEQRKDLKRIWTETGGEEGDE